MFARSALLVALLIVNAAAALADSTGGAGAPGGGEHVAPVETAIPAVRPPRRPSGDSDGDVIVTGCDFCNR